MFAYLSTLFDFYSRNFLPTPSPPMAPATKTSSYDVVHAGEHLFKVVGHSLFKDSDDSLTSEPFSVGGYEWALVYFPNGDTRIADGQFISIFLKLLSASKDGVTASYGFSLQDPASPTTGEKYKCKSNTSMKFSSSNSGFGGSKFVSKSDLAASGCLNDDCLVIKGTMEIVTTKLIQGREHDDDDNCVVVPPSDVSEHLQDLLGSNLKADMTVKIGWLKRFQVHGCVLAAHSPVFSTLVETKQKSIRIEDIDAKVFEILLHYLYNDSLPDFMKETTEYAINMTQHLLIVANRYAIERLNLMCQSKLSKVIDVNTMGATLAFAEEHSCQQLKACCLEYMVRDGDRLQAIMRTEGFRQLKQNHPHVVSNILDKVIDKL
ncbi:BTB/POZ and MATH domain-containing protein 1-like [Lolium rigidum]|uniref:BTB/POZ and MATH domain-containing protein 1-like n=1 Tax=Lolium rigidum TaxID=89674 RepID=UPI001F5D937D|nr:BTB/POZ and MATH domain-containing protein 1-like [Lolium rigidum]